MIVNDDHLMNKRSTVEPGFTRKALGTYADLALVLGLALAMLAFIYVPLLSHNLVRFSLGVILILFLPGYSFLAAIYPGKEDLGHLERAVLSIGLSIILVPFVGFFLNYTTWGVTGNTILFFVMLLILFCLILAFLRRYSLPAEKRFRVDFGGPVIQAKKLLLPASKQKGDVTISVLLICSLVLFAAVIGYLVVMPYQADKYTEFYLYGPGGNLSNYPANFTLGEKKPVILGIVNREGMAKDYDLAVTLNNGTESHRIFLDHLVLADNETLEKTINLTPDRIGDRQNLKFLLYMDGSPADPYRECNLWINVTEPSAGETADNNASVALNATGSP